MSDLTRQASIASRCARAPDVLIPEPGEAISRHLAECSACRAMAEAMANAVVYPGRPTLALPRYQQQAVDLVELRPVPQELLIKRLTHRDCDNEYLLLALEALRAREWNQKGLPETCSIGERLQHDLVFSAWIAQTDGRITPVALLSGRCSRQAAPRWNDLAANPTMMRNPASVSFYEVIVARQFRGRNIGLKLFLQAAEFCRNLFPDVIIRTVSPIYGLRAWLANILGLSADIVDLMDAQRAHWNRLRGPHESLLHDIVRSSGGLQALRSWLTIDLVEWLKQVCAYPGRAEQVWVASPREVQADVERLFKILAASYTGTWRHGSRPEAISLVCYVSHFHLRQGASEERYDVFARNDPDSLGMTISFIYPQESKRLVNVAAFSKKRRSSIADPAGLGAADSMNLVSGDLSPFCPPLPGSP